MKTYVYLLFAVAIAVVIWKRNEIMEKLFPKVLPTPTPDDEKKSIPNKGDSFPLTVGSRGDRVKKLQQALNTLFDSKLSTDGIFGPKTKTALTSNKQSANVSEEEYNTLIDLANKGTKAVTNVASKAANNMLDYAKKMLLNGKSKFQRNE